MVQPIDRAAFLAAARAEVMAVPLPGGITFFVREVSVADTQRASRAEEADSEPHGLARAAAVYLCDEQGNQLFNPYSPEDLALISALGWKKVRAILKAGDKFNAMEPDEKKGEAGDRNS